MVVAGTLVAFPLVEVYDGGILRYLLLVPHCLEELAELSK